MALEIKARRQTVDVEIGNETVRLYCTRPTNKELIAYQGDLLGKGRSLDGGHLARVQLDWGERMLLGFREGDILVDGAPLTIDEQGHWKDTLRENQPDLLISVARALFDSATGRRVDEPVKSPLV